MNVGPRVMCSGGAGVDGGGGEASHLVGQVGFGVVGEVVGLGAAPRWQCGGQGLESPQLHPYLLG